MVKNIENLKYLENDGESSKKSTAIKKPQKHGLSDGKVRFSKFSAIVEKIEFFDIFKPPPLYMLVKGSIFLRSNKCPLGTSSLVNSSRKAAGFQAPQSMKFRPT